MARTSLTIDGAALGALLDDLAQVKSEFEAGDDNATVTADACGHAGLADRVTSFATTWNDRRSTLAGRIGELGEVLATIDATFTDIESELEAALAGDGA